MLLTGLLAAILAVYYLGPCSFTVEGITFKAGLAPSATAATELRLPPFGTISARTHQGPVKLYLALDQIDSQSFKTNIKNPSNSKEIIEKMQKKSDDYLRIFVMRQVTFAFLTSLFAILLIWRCGIKTALLQALLSLVLLSLPLLYAIGTYDEQAFKEPEYEGVIAMAPTLMDFASKTLDNLDLIKQNTDLVVVNLRKLFTSADSLMVMADPQEQPKAVKVLLVADLHSNPVGIELMKSMIRNFHIDLIINAGDLTDLGTAAEAESISGLQDINTPQLFAAGNHDSPATLKIVSAYDQFTVLNGQMVSAAGLKVLGFPDPLASEEALDYTNSKDNEEMLAQEAIRIKAELKRQGYPDILVVHDPSLGRELISSAHLTVSGHDHKPSVLQQGQSLFIDPGTTGAAGIRGLYSEEGQEYSAAVAYVIPNKGVIAVDQIEYSPVSNQFSLHRKLLQKVNFSEGPTQ